MYKFHITTDGTAHHSIMVDGSMVNPGPHHVTTASAAANGVECYPTYTLQQHAMLCLQLAALTCVWGTVSR